MTFQTKSFSVLFAVLLFSLFSWQVKSGVLSESRNILFTNATVPDPELLTIDGHEVRLMDEISNYNVTWINFWASWCAPCREEFPLMEELYRKYRDDGFHVLAINYREDLQTIDTFLEEFPLSFPVMTDFEGTVSEQFRVSVLPTSYLVDQDGTILHAGTGIQAFWENRIQSILEADHD